MAVQFLSPHPCRFRLRLRAGLVSLLLVGIALGWAALEVMPGWFGRKGLDNTTLPPPIQKLVPFHKPLGEPRPGDWLARFSEPGETYAEYVRGRPVRADSRRRILYIQPVGDFNPTQRKIVQITVDYMRIFFQLSAQVCDDLPLSLIPPRARRISPIGRTPQMLTSYVRDELLKPRLPRDAVALIALTASDL
jgi:archaemetzincin